MRTKWRTKLKIEVSLVGLIFGDGVRIFAVREKIVDDSAQVEVNSDEIIELPEESYRVIENKS